MIERPEHLQLLRRADALSAFLAGDFDKPELANEIGVSSQTAYRIVSQFCDDGIIERGDGSSYTITPYGEAIGTTVLEYIEQMNRLCELKRLISSIPQDVAFDPDDFSDATVVHATPEEPLKPIQRFIDRFEAADRIKSFNKSFLEPMYLDLLIEKLESGTETVLIYKPAVVEAIYDHHETLADLLIDAPNVEAYELSSLPFSLTVFDGRVGIGIHPEPPGAPVSWVESDDDGAVSWANQLFERYREQAEPLRA